MSEQEETSPRTVGLVLAAAAFLFGGVALDFFVGPLLAYASLTHVSDPIWLVGIVEAFMFFWLGTTMLIIGLVTLDVKPVLRPLQKIWDSIVRFLNRKI